MATYTVAQQMMIDDGLPPSLIIDQETRRRHWELNPPKRSFYETRLIMIAALTEEQLRLLFDLKDSKERGAASLACSGYRLASTAVIEKLGLAQQYGYGPTSFRITEAGLKELEKHKRPEPKPFTHHTIEKSERTSGYGSYSGSTTISSKVPAKEPKPAKAKRKPAAKANPNLSAICVECGVNSKNRAAALDFLFEKIGKMQSVAAVMKAIYGSGKATESATDIVIKSLQRDLSNSNAKEKYEVKRTKDSKGVYTYGLYKK